MNEEAKARYIINEEEIALLERVEGIGEMKSSEDFMKNSKEGLAVLCAMQRKSNDMFLRRYKAACEVIDIIARKVGIDPDDSGFYLYAAYNGGTTPITDRIESWFSRSGEKAQLKRKLQELEQENSILRSLINKN